MHTFFLDLFHYNHHYNKELIRALKAHPEDVSDKCLQLFSHILNVHRAWNYKIQPGEAPYDGWQMHQIHEYDEINQQNWEDSMRILETSDLEQIVTYSISTGQVFNTRIRDLLFHIINHSTYHRAQIATEFRQCGLKPLLTDYIMYKMND